MRPSSAALSRALTPVLVLALALAVLAVAPRASAAEPHPIVERISGADSTIVSAAVSQRFATEADVVVLARADAYPDALAAAPLAALRDAPILLVPQTGTLPRHIFGELDRLAPSTAIILGGVAAVDQGVQEQVERMGISVQRIGGLTRTGTAALVADVIVAETGVDRAYVVRGYHPSPHGGWPDAVAVSGLAAAQGRPILLSDGVGLDEPTTTALDRIGTTEVTLVGGTAVLADSVEAAAAQGGRSVRRIAGDSRYTTSAAVARDGFTDRQGMGQVFLVGGGNFADALVTSVHAAAAGGTMMLADSHGWSSSAARALIGERWAEIEKIWTVGSGDELAPAVDHDLVDRTMPRPAADTSSGIRIPPGASIQSAIDAHPEGTSFILEAGIHRGQTFVPRSGDRITGEPGAILDGGVVLDKATGRDGANGELVLDAPAMATPAYDPAWELLPGHEREGLPNDLWVGHRRLRHVNTAAEVMAVPHSWYYDYEAGEILANPTLRSTPGELVLAMTREAIATNGGGDIITGVVIRNLVIRHYANLPSAGVVDLGDSLNWDVGNLTIIDNHGVGLRTGPGLYLHDSRIVRQGQMGIAGTDTDFADTKAPVTIERNEIAFNGELRFEWAWEGGSIKFGQADGTRLLGNWVHNHPGPGPWMDEFCSNSTISQNLIEHNGQHGLMYEISTAGTLTDNIVRFNGLLGEGDGGSGIWISNSPDTEVGWNVVEGNRLPISAQTSPPQEGRDAMPIEDLDVHDNDVRIDYLLPGMRVTSDADYVYTQGNNRFQGNRYRTRLDEEFQFYWGDFYSINAWRDDLGFDQTGRFEDINLPAQAFAGRPAFTQSAFGASAG